MSLCEHGNNAEICYSCKIKNINILNFTNNNDFEDVSRMISPDDFEIGQIYRMRSSNNMFGFAGGDSIFIVEIINLVYEKSINNDIEYDIDFCTDLTDCVNDVHYIEREPKIDTEVHDNSESIIKNKLTSSFIQSKKFIKIFECIVNNVDRSNKKRFWYLCVETAKPYIILSNITMNSSSFLIQYKFIKQDLSAQEAAFSTMRNPMGENEN